jgi:hypothetical protein
METNIGNPTATVYRPVAFTGRHPGMTAAGYNRLKRETPSRLPVLLKCAEALFSHVQIQFKACQKAYEQGTLKEADYEKLQDLVYALFDVLESALMELGIKTPNVVLKSGPVKHPFEAVSVQFQALTQAFESCRRANKAGILAEADIANLFMAIERTQGVFYEFADGETEAGKPDFGHRLWLFSDASDSLGLTDTVSFMTEKADAVLTMLGNAFAEEDGPRLNDDAIYYALMTVKHEVADIRSVVKAFHQAGKKQEQRV